MHTLLKTYQKRLTNLTAKNRSLLLLRLYSGQFVDVRELSVLEKENEFSLIRKLIARKKSIRLCSTLDSRHNDTNRMSLQLKRLQRNQGLVEEETGAQNLYIGYPFVTGKLLDDTPIRCPLLFFPMRLRVRDNFWVLERRTEVSISFNKSFLLAFSHYNRIIFEDDILDKDFDELSKDPTEFLTQLYHTLEESPLEIAFRPDQFEEKLAYFTSDTRKSFAQTHEAGRLDLQPQAVLGLFPQMDSYLAPDYERLLHDETTPDLSHFFTGDKLKSADPVREEEIFAPYALDASQESVLRQVKQGQSLVVQGPPGTGKSQLICNLATDFMARGKRVLIVCQKRAALDVVYQRLGEKGVHEFAALVHDFRADRKRIFEQIAGLIENLDAFKKQNNSLDAIYLERNFLQYSRSVDRCSELLENFRTALFDESVCGLSPKELYLTSDPDAEAIDLKDIFRAFHFSEYQTFLRTLRTYIAYAVRLDKESYVWQERVSFAGFGISDLKKMQAMLTEVGTFKQQIAEAVGTHIGQNVNYDFCESVLEKNEDGQELLSILDQEKVFRYFRNVLPHRSLDESWIENKTAVIRACFENDGLETSVPREELAQAQEHIEAYRQAKKRFFKRTFFSKAKKKYVRELLEKYNLEDDEEGLQQLMNRLDNRMNLEHNITQLQDAEWVQEVPETYVWEDFSDWLEAYRRALRAKRLFQGFRQVVEKLDQAELEYATLRDYLNDLFHILDRIPKKKQVWQQYLHPRQIRWVLDDSQRAQKLSRALDEDFDDLCEFDKIRDRLTQQETEVVARLKAHFGYFDSEKTLALFENSLRLAWLAHLEEQEPILRAVSSLKLEQAEQELQDAITEKYKLSTDTLLLKLREQTYQNVKYNRLRNRTTYRDLEHQVKKKRSLWALRKVVSTFSEELFDLLPCWLASPESVSAIFPMKQLFDLVIFDEASQCYAEKGLPAVYRAQQTVIVGDDKQLPPYNLYRPRWEQEADEKDETLSPELEVESLLDLGKQFLPEASLWGHYRSQALELIDFSNQHFYGQRLRMVPEFVQFQREEPAISYTRVEGIWHQNSNQSEVMEVARQVRNRVRAGETSIGVITFNFQQQEAIRDLFELTEFPLPEDFFIKNIENVQGDERDTIIFSIGYAPDTQGRFRAQFGLLNLKGGENRLNVAITRARKRISIVSSIFPHQLRVEETQHPGPKLLKAYLQYAHDVSEGQYQPTFPPREAHAPTWYLRETIKNEHFQPQFPFADLVAADESARLLRTDDERYYESLSAKEWHAYQPAHLKAKNWEVRDIYSRNYWRKRAEIQESLADNSD